MRFGEYVEWKCAEEDWGIIPKPYPAAKYVQPWYSSLAQRLLPKGLRSSTVKRCAPFSDAMALGWIIPLAADVSFQTNEDATWVDYKWEFHKPMVEPHTWEQIEGFPRRHPPLKFMNYWIADLPKGWSMLYMPILNRPSPHLMMFSGLVDSGYYEFVNFPFLFTTPNFSGIIEAGTPLVQAVPIRSGELRHRGHITSMWKGDHERIEKTRRLRASHESHYRDKVWKRG